MNSNDYVTKKDVIKIVNDILDKKQKESTQAIKECIKKGIRKSALKTRNHLDW